MKQNNYEAMTAEIGAIFTEAIGADERVQEAIQARDQLRDKHRRLEAGIAALKADLAKTEAAIEDDRLSLADGSAADVVKVNKRVSNNLSLAETTNQSIEAMQAQFEGMQRDLRYVAENVGTAICSVMNRQFFDEYQGQVSAIVEQAIGLITAYNDAASAAVREAGGRTTASTRPHRLHLGDAGSLFQLIANHQHIARTIPAPAPPVAPSHVPLGRAMR